MLAKTLFGLLFLFTFSLSCSQIQVKEQEEAINQVLSLRENPCQPQGMNCTVLFETFSFPMTDNIAVPGCGSPCVVTPAMRITSCNVDGATELFFEEISISQSECCNLNQQELDAFFESFIASFISSVDPSVTAPNCEDDILFATNYIKQSCIKYCQSTDQQLYINPETNEKFILDLSIYLRCGEDGGCCIERKEWCKPGPSNLAIAIEAHTESFDGECLEKFKCPESGFVFNNEDCIVQRCPE